MISLGFLLAALSLRAADTEHCATCGAVPYGHVYLVQDAVTFEKVAICTNCEAIYPTCFVCGLPARTNAPGFVALPDGRSLCARDASTAVLQSDDGLRICRDARGALDRLFSRFLAFPDTNVTVTIVDRVHLVDLFKLAGNDYHCPNVWGYTQSSTNENRVEHHISLMSGLPLDWFQATCAHEYTHTWVSDNVPADRRKTFGRDSEEGFCELVSFLFMDSQDDQAQKARILRNAYTRGQVDLYVAAEKSYGLNEVVDWVKYGTDEELSADDPGRVRRIALPRPAGSPAINLVRMAPASAPAALVLKAVFWDPAHPSALINDHTFIVNEDGKVRIGATNVLVRCLAIRQNGVRIRLLASGEEKELLLKRR